MVENCDANMTCRAVSQIDDRMDRFTERQSILEEMVSLLVPSQLRLTTKIRSQKSFIMSGRGAMTRMVLQIDLTMPVHREDLGPQPSVASPDDELTTCTLDLEQDGNPSSWHTDGVRLTLSSLNTRQLRSYGPNRSTRTGVCLADGYDAPSLG